jgi:hypothetical protein
MDVFVISKAINANSAARILSLAMHVTPHTTEIKNALCSLLYARGKASCGFWAKVVGVSRTTACYGIRQAAASTDESSIAPDLQAIECAEM